MALVTRNNKSLIDFNSTIWREFKIDLDLLQIECSLENRGFGILNVEEENPTNLSMQINV